MIFHTDDIDIDILCRRLLWASGSETMLAVYNVGIYSDKKLIGKSKYKIF